MINPYQPVVPVEGASSLPARGESLSRMLLTAAASVGLTLALWVLLVSLLDRRVHGSEMAVWAGTLWLSAMLSTALVAWSRWSVRPTISCTIAFAVFGVGYMLCEGFVFGNVSQGGDPSITRFVIWNMIMLPLGACVAANVGWRRRKASSLLGGEGHESLSPKEL